MEFVLPLSVAAGTYFSRNLSGAAKPFEMEFTPSSEADREFLGQADSFVYPVKFFWLHECCLCKHSVQEVMYAKVNDTIRGGLISMKKYYCLLWVFV